MQIYTLLTSFGVFNYIFKSSFSQFYKISSSIQRQLIYYEGKNTDLNIIFKIEDTYLRYNQTTLGYISECYNIGR